MLENPIDSGKYDGGWLGTRFRPLRRTLSLVAICWPMIACSGTSKDIEEARQLASTGQTELAISKVETLLTEEPTLRDAHLALGDIHLNAALDLLEAKDKEAAAEHSKKALAAYEGVQQLEADTTGLIPVKMAYALKALRKATHTDREMADRYRSLVAEAWDCCKHPGVLQLIEDEQYPEYLKQGNWTPSNWTRHPLFEQPVPTTDEVSFIVRPGGATAYALEDVTEVGQLPELASNRGPLTDDFITFEDFFNKEQEEHVGYLDIRGDEGCHIKERIGARIKTDRCARVGAWEGSGKLQLRDGPCWGACPPGTHASLVDTQDIVRGSVTCTGMAGDSGCQVRYATAHMVSHRVKTDAVWVVSAPVSRGFRETVQLAHDAGLTEIRDHLVAGEWALGLPFPLLGWVPGEVAKKESFVDATGIILRIQAEQGAFTFTNGMLTDWQPVEAP